MNANRLSLRKRILFIAVLLAGALLIVFVAMEFYVRFTNPYIDLWAWTGRKAGKNPISEWAVADAFCAYRAKPAAFRKIGKTVNRYGFVSTPEMPVAKEPREIRIAFFGESSTAGTGQYLADRQTWPWKVAARVQQELPDRKISYINAANGGYTSFESYGRFWSRVRFFNPDIMVIDHGWNEMYYFSHKKMETIENWRALPDGSWNLDVGDKFQMIAPSWIDHFIRYSQIFVRARIVLSGFKMGEIGAHAEEEAESDFDRRAVDVWRTNLKLFRETARTLNIDMFVCKQPTMIMPGSRNEYQDKIVKRTQGFDYDAHVRAFQEIYKVIDDEIPGDRIIDLTSISGHQEFLFDHIHPTDLGTDKIAEIVTNRLVQHIKSKGTTGSVPP